MARENQGLHIILIVFVMLTIVLGVTSYVFYRRSDEAALRAETNADEAGKLSNDNAKLEDDLNALKRMIGANESEKVVEINKQFEEDMKNYGSAYPADARFYSPLLEKMLKTIEEKNTDLSSAKEEIKRLDNLYAQREESKDPQLKQFAEARDKAAKDLAEERTKFTSEVERKNVEAEKLHEQMQQQRKTSADKIAQVRSELQKTESLADKRGTVIDKQAEIIEEFTKGKIEAPDGEVLWANQREGTVWINLGRADALRRQVTFSVYPAGNTNLTVDDKKGSVEVTHVLGEHLAEARVLEDEVGDPIVPGDKIHTVLWNAGRKRHFALAGLIDLDGDGRSDLDKMIDIIRLNGGEVDCYIADKGEKANQVVGEIDVNTNALILGKAPDERGEPAQLDAYTKILREAGQLRTPTVQLGDMLQRMGWRNVSHVVRYGRGANPEDFRAKPAEGVPRKSTGNVSDLYQKREPPKRAPSGGRYYRF